MDLSTKKTFEKILLKSLFLFIFFLIKYFVCGNKSAKCRLYSTVQLKCEDGVEKLSFGN